MFDIPGTWLWATIGDVLQVQTGASFKKEEAGNEGVRILRGGNIVGGTYVFKEDDIFISKELVSEGILLRRNDLITPAVTSIENVGKIARIKEEHHMISAGGFVFILRPFLQDDVLSQYLCYLIKSPAIIEPIVIIFVMYNSVKITELAQFGIIPISDAINDPTKGVFTISLAIFSSPTKCITPFNIKLIIRIRLVFFYNIIKII